MSLELVVNNPNPILLSTDSVVRTPPNPGYVAKNPATLASVLRHILEKEGK